MWPNPGRVHLGGSQETAAGWVGDRSAVGGAECGERVELCLPAVAGQPAGGVREPALPPELYGRIAGIWAARVVSVSRPAGLCSNASRLPGAARLVTGGGKDTG